jgi:hypothetical protein
VHLTQRGRKAPFFILVGDRAPTDGRLMAETLSLMRQEVLRVRKEKEKTSRRKGVRASLGSGRHLAMLCALMVCTAALTAGSFIRSLPYGLIALGLGTALDAAYAGHSGVPAAEGISDKAGAPLIFAGMAVATAGVMLLKWQ